MKRVVSFLMAAAVGGLMLLAPGKAGAIQVKVSGEMWNRWTATFETNTGKISNLNALSVNRLSVERGYLNQQGSGRGVWYELR